jgi:hypothetical protein
MNRRKFLGAAASGAALSVFDWMRYFERNGVPGTSKELGIAKAAAQAGGTPKFLMYWFIEGGWDGFSMLNPVATPNDALGGSSRAPQDQTYRPKGIALDAGGLYPVQQSGNIRYGHLAAEGVSLFPDLAVVSSHYGSTFHSGSRFDYHYGKYTNSNMGAARGLDERSVMQAFCEANGASYLLPHVSFHRWIADGELALANYPEGTGYFERSGPAHAHTIYGGTPTLMRARIDQIAKSRGTGRDALVHKFVDNLHQNFMKDKNSESVKAFTAAVDAHRTLVSGGGNLNAQTLFTDQALRTDFGVTADDEKTSSAEINNSAARSKESPNINVQAMMAYELMTKSVSTGFWLESRDIRGFDTHRPRNFVLQNKGQVDQKMDMDKNLWTPLKALVKRLKNTQYQTTGKSYYEMSTIVLASEMGRSLGGGDDDVCQHWDVSSVAFLGGQVKGNTQVGRVGTVTRQPIPMMPDGTLDASFDPLTGVLKNGQNKNPASYVSDAGHVYATALELAGVPKAMQTGRNSRPVMNFVKK